VPTAAGDRDDEELAAAWLAGTDDAMRRLWDRYGTLVHTFCARAIIDRDAATDCTQETFVSAWRSRERFDPARGNLAGWLLGIARHRVHDTYRATARTPVPRDELPVERLRAPDESEHLVSRLLLADALETLEDRPRRVLHLAYYEGLSQAEIADRLDVPLGTVKSDMRRALVRLRRTVAGGGTDG
jgi:RNA polymerase sigma-70 factor (ECF subfamily)